MTSRKKAPYWELPAFVQYSKKMCTAITIFWMVYRVINFIVLFIHLDSSDAIVRLVSGVDTVMICNMGFYMGKSGFENIAKIVAARNYHDEDEDNDDEKTEDESEG